MDIHHQIREVLADLWPTHFGFGEADSEQIFRPLLNHTEGTANTVIMAFVSFSKAVNVFWGL